MKNLIVDIGANKGDFCIHAAKYNPNHSILAIEPIPFLCKKLEHLAEKNNLKNLYIYECAIDKKSYHADLNISSKTDYGVSSILNFNHDVINTNEYWKSRKDLKNDSIIQVEVKKLKDVLNDYDNFLVEFIKIDAQGKDIEVLESCENHLEKIQAGMLEVSTTNFSKLYENEKHNLTSALNFLEENNFEIYSLSPNDPASNEMNVYFKKKNIEISYLEETLNLKKLKIYSAKRYWNLPNSKNGIFLPLLKHLIRLLFRPFK